MLDMCDFIEKADIPKKEKEKILFGEFQKVILQTRCTFGFTYTDNDENVLRGRVGRFSGFRNGTQRLDFIPNNKWPKSRSSERTLLRYWDEGRSGWRSFKKDRFVVVTSFWDEKNKKWVDTPDQANVSSNWKEIRSLNKISDYKQSNRPDTKEEKIKRERVAKKEFEKRQRQIQQTQSKLKKSFVIEGGIIKTI